MSEPTQISLPAPAERPRLLVLAGEHSGDEHAARLLRDTRALIGAEAGPVAAVGGEELRAEADCFLFDLVEHSVIGFLEVLKNYGFFKAFFHALADWVEEHRPEAVLFVDYPGFNLRFAAELHRRGLSRKGGGAIGLFYYIAPQVWAWKPKRRFKMANLLDGLGCILPFELETFADTTLPTRFVGHPMAAPGFPLPVRQAPGEPVLLLPGSREQQVRKVFPLQLEIFRRVAEGRPGTRGRVIFPSPKIRAVLEDVLATAAPDLRTAVSLEPKGEALAGSAVLMSSGTMSLAVALAGMPGLIIQRVKTLTYLLGRVLITIDYIGLANLLLQRPHIPEYIQNVDTAAAARELEACLDDPARLEKARLGARELLDLLSADGAHPGGQWLAECLGSKPAKD